MILREAEFALGTEHPLRRDTANHRGFQRRFLAKLRTDQRERGNHASLYVGRSAHNFETSLFARIDVAQIEAVRVRMLFDLQDFSREHAAESRGQFLYVLNYQPRITEAPRNLLRRCVDAHEIFEPA